MYDEILLQHHIPVGVERVINMRTVFYERNIYECGNSFVLILEVFYVGPLSTFK